VKCLGGGGMFPGKDPPCWLCHRLQLSGTIKGWFKGQSLNFFLHLMWWWLLFWLEAIRIIQLQLRCLKEVSGITELRLSALYPSYHLGSLYTIIKNEFVAWHQ
jgi:hypothetical protein